MKLVCAQSQLSTNLSLVSRAVASRPSHPVLANVLLIADEETQQIKLSAFDLSLGIQTSFPATVQAGGKLTLPARLFTDIVSRLPDGDITLDASSDSEEEPTYVTTITCASGRYQVRGMSADDFPELPVVDDGDVVQLPAIALIEGLRSSLFSASPDEAKQVLTGVHLTMTDNGLEFAATDGHRLAVVETLNTEPDEKPAKSAKKKNEEGQELDVTIPAKALQELIKMLDRQADHSVIVRFDRGQAVFEWTDQRLTTRLLEGQYPNYRQLIPKQFAHQATVDRRQFLSALERIAVLADQKNNIAKLTLNNSKETLALSVDAADVGSGEETIPAQITGEDLIIAFNVKYLLDGLKTLNTSEIQMQFNTSTSPAIFTPLGGLKLTYLVMPVQIRGN
ncbi:DNA polymerase III, beta subunit [Leptolyngbyaceae cyanobacterium JSC-12]|nr:DNA polymerase III, beta subunit [Leptolyngbyaceae cyanobacterium JSC-12]